MIPSFWTDIITVTQSYNTGAVDVDGPIFNPDWSNSWMIADCFIKVTSSVTSEGRTVEEYMLLADSNAFISKGDRITWEAPNGQTYHFIIDGRPQFHRSPTGLVNHLRVRLEVADG